MKREGPRVRYRRVLYESLTILRRAQEHMKVTEIEGVLKQTETPARNTIQHIERVALLAAAVADLHTFAGSKNMVGLQQYITEETQINLPLALH